MSDDTTNPPLKHCPRCKQNLPMTEYHRNSRQPDGVGTYCKDCTSIRNGTFPVRRRFTDDGKKRCSICHQFLPLEQFSKNKANKCGYASACKQCKHILSGASDVKSYKAPEGMKRCSICRQELPLECFCKHGSGGLQSACKDCGRRKAGHTKRIKTNLSKREQWVIRSHRRRARKKAKTSFFSPQHWMRALNYFEHRCAVCGKPRGLWHTLAPDHWIPLASPDCPGTIPTNIIPLCHGIDGCNNHKHDRDAREWLICDYGKQKANQILAQIEAYFEWVKQQDVHDHPNGFL